MKYQHRQSCYSRIKRMICMLAFAAVLAGLLMNTPVLAAAEAEQTKGSISIGCPAEGLEFSLYRVADYKDTGDFALIEKFQNYRVSLDSDEWKGTARTLVDYAERDGIQADAELKSESDKTVCFENLSRGLYLVKGQEIEAQDNGKAKISVPPVSLIALPDASQKDTLHIRVNLKYDEEKMDNIEASQTKIHVLKVWKQDQVKERPASVQVDLLRTDQNGTTTVVDSQILKKENQWSYTWENLSSQVSWSVVETEVPSGYTVSTSREGNTVVLTNTKTADSEDKSESTDKTGTSGENGGNSSQKLPQTGQLWWPVPLLMLAGVICLLAGKQLRKSMEEKK